MHSAYPLITITAIAGLVAVVTQSVENPTTGETTATSHIPVKDRCTIYAAGTSDEYIDKFEAKLRNSMTSRFQALVRWPGVDNAPVTITYSFPSDGVDVDGATNNLNATLTSQFTTESAWKAVFAQVFEDWSDITGNVYVEVTDDDEDLFGAPGPLSGGSGRGDVRIVGYSIDGPLGALAFNNFPGPSGGDMVLDTDEDWALADNHFRFLRNIAGHEHGHGMGLLHVCPESETKLMEPRFSDSFDGPQHDDIRGATYFYGDFYEPNENAASAGLINAFVGSGGWEPFDLPNMSIRDGADADYYTFTIGDAGLVDVSVVIVGEVYGNGPQVSNIECVADNDFDSNLLADPQLAVLDTDGTTVLATADLNGFGGDELLLDVELPVAGTYYIRVQPTDVNGISQIYDLTGIIKVPIIFGAACVCDLNGDKAVGTADLSILISAFGSRVQAGDLSGDLNGDLVVDSADLGIMIGDFGPCKQ